MAYDAKAVANCFLDMAAKRGTTLTPMKLQKLIFFAHGWNLALYGEPLISDPVQAWKFGPVVPSIYHEFKHSGSGSIYGKATEFSFTEGRLVEPALPVRDERAHHVLEQIWQSYGKLSAVQLSNLTHLPGTPWAAVWERTGGAQFSVISDEEIKRYFLAQAEKNKARQSAQDAAQG